MTSLSGTSSARCFATRFSAAALVKMCLLVVISLLHAGLANAAELVESHGALRQGAASGEAIVGDHVAATMAAPSDVLVASADDRVTAVMAVMMAKPTAHEEERHSDAEKSRLETTNVGVSSTQSAMVSSDSNVWLIISMDMHREGEYESA
jgi:hypothetical protein